MPASKAQRASAADKRKRAVALRLAGMDWQAVADQSGYASPGAACTAVTEALKVNQRELSEAVDELRAVELARYDRLQAAFWPKAIGDKDPKAAEVVLKCIAGRNKLNGTEAAIRAEHSGPGGGPISFTTTELEEFEALLSAGDVTTPAATESGDTSGDGY
ncbi:hypothetical protein [Streptomyces sp. NPDC005548]|uniref:hypothetical protein n=1 Tax=Streptomyces sp. NPDC005548 TaxID=3364724 RepID=UPI0036A6885A